MTMYRQCTLRKGNVQQTAWIEDKQLQVGMHVELKSEKEGEQQGWEILAMGPQHAEEQVMELDRRSHAAAH